MAAQLLEIDLDTIRLDDQANPRQHVDKDRIADLANSIKAHGVLQPVIVREDGDVYRLVAGQRRFLAAIDAGLSTIPAIVRQVNGDAGSIAIVENLQREQLTPIEEARAFLRAIGEGLSEPQLAAAIGISEQTIRDRLRLLELPEKVQEKVDAREVTLGSAKSLQTFAPAGPAVLEKIVALLDAADPYSDPVTPRDLDSDPAWVLETALDELAREKAVDRPFVADPVSGYRGILADDSIPWPANIDVKALKEKAKKLPEHDGSYRQLRAAAPNFDADDYDAARAYGCLLQLDSRNGHKGFITDPDWLADRLSQKLDVAIAKHAKKTGTSKKTSKAPAGDVADAETQRREAERKERQREQAAMLAARERNVELGVKLFKELHAPPLTLEAAQLVAGVVLHYAGEDLGRRGLRYIDEESQTVTTRKDGTISRVSHLRGVVECRGLLEKRLASCTSGEQILGVLVQALAASHYADKGAAPQSDRAGEVRGLDWNPIGGPPLGELVEKIAGDHVPASVLDARAKPKSGRRPARP